jgi:signal transduction histidine kinase
VVGDTRENGLEVLRRVRTQLLIGLPLLVLATFLGAFAIAGAALRPVEAMRRRASELTTGDPALRLPVPSASDEISRLGVTLNALLARVEATLARERTFVAHASHELRTPLALLRTQLELAVRRPRPAYELVEAIRSAEVEVDRLQRLAEDLLLLAQAGDGGLAVHLEDVDVSDLFDDASARFAAAVAESGRRLVTDAAAGMTRADRPQLQQALTNLIANAFEHGGGTIRLAARGREGHLELVVSDEGDGFAPEMLEHGADRFARGQSSGGAGLGLAIVTEIAAAHNGSAGMRNLDTGAESWISVPSASTPTADDVSRAAPPAAVSPSSRPA